MSREQAVAIGPALAARLAALEPKQAASLAKRYENALAILEQVSAVPEEQEKDR